MTIRFLLQFLIKQILLASRLSTLPFLKVTFLCNLVMTYSMARFLDIQGYFQMYMHLLISLHPYSIHSKTEDTCTGTYVVNSRESFAKTILSSINLASGTTSMPLIL